MKCLMTMNKPSWRLSRKGSRAGCSGFIFNHNTIKINICWKQTSITWKRVQHIHGKVSPQIFVGYMWDSFSDFNRKMQDKMFYCNHDSSKTSSEHPCFWVISRYSVQDTVLSIYFLILKTCRFGCNRSGIWTLYFRAHLHAMWSSWNCH